jgi:hypothetical protein
MNYWRDATSKYDLREPRRGANETVWMRRQEGHPLFISATLDIDVPAPTKRTTFQNYLYIRTADGMSTTERIK